MVVRMRSRVRRALLPALSVAVAASLVGPLASAGAAVSQTPGSETIASHAAWAPVSDPDRLPRSNPGYFRVTTDDGQLAPVYWMPAGAAATAPSEVQSMHVYRTDVASGFADRFDVTIYGEGTAVVSPTAGARAHARGRQRRYWTDCPSGYSCLWQFDHGDGRMLQFHDPGSWQNMAWYSFNNDASSTWNRKADRSTLYAPEPDGVGFLACVYAGYSWDNLGSFWNNNISSIKIREGNNC